jgi:hypothetical protein
VTAFEIPLRASTAQKFTIAMNSVTYTMRFTWCEPSSSWILDIGDSVNAPLAQGIPIVTGADLLEQFAYLGIGGELVVQSDYDTDAVPTFDNLGVLGRVYFVVSP